MPVNIYNDYNGDQIAYLCEDIWDLPTQISELKNWLTEQGTELPSGKYVADIGFGIRNGAIGGGGTINSTMIYIMSKKGIEIFFSEYPASDKE
ncbi:MAG: hypothetical protein Salg2KO_22990 [Salibacteraceae bacterium]